MHWELLGLATMIVGVAALAASVRAALYLLVITTVFGAAAAFSLPSLGGASVLVPSLFLVFFVLRLFMAGGEGPVFRSVAPLGPGFWLLVLTVFALFTAFFYPRLMEGQIETMIVQRSVSSHSTIAMTPLGPSSNNITQSVYALGGLICFAFTFAYFRRFGSSRDLIGAILVVAAVNLAFAVLDIVTYYSGTAYLLDIVRTANYALLTGAEKGGFKRISGTFSEASAFAGYTIVLFAFIASLWLERVRTVTTGAIGALLFLALVFSTSATALVALAVVLTFLGARSLRSVMRRDPDARPAFVALMALAAPLAALAILVAFPDLLDAISNFFNEMLFDKIGSQSGQERFMWNASAYQVFLDTWGLGAGLGSVQASSYALVLLSNLGIIGAVLFSIFIGSVLLLRTDPGVSPLDRKVVRATKAGVIASLAEAFTSGTVYDLGPMFYALCGAAVALHALSAPVVHRRILLRENPGGESSIAATGGRGR